MSNPLFKVLPEVLMFCIILGLFVESARAGGTSPLRCRWLAPASIVVLLVALFFPHQQGELFYGAYTIDGFSQFFKMAVAFGYCFLVLNALRHPSQADHPRSDYFLFMSLSAWGLMILASAVELITMLLALELASYSLYVLIPLRGNSRESAEAAAKYILFGAAATAVSLFGLSYIMAGQDTTYVARLMQADWSFGGNATAAIGMCLFLCAMFFKLALFPFHFWCPDVYQGASNETAAFVCTLPKLGAIVVLVRLAACLKPGLEIVNALALLALVSMFFGNFCALAQKDLKRMLGFSSIAHAGYIMVGLVSGTASGFAAAAFYALAYVTMNLLCFWVISRIATDGRNLRYEDLNGLYKRSPALAFALAVGAFSLVGLPPTAGFMGKLFLIAAAWGQGYDWLVIALVLNSAIAIYYYLSLVRHAYTEEDGGRMAQVDGGKYATCGALVLSASVLLLGILPAFFFNFLAGAALG